MSLIWFCPGNSVSVPMILDGLNHKLGVLLWNVWGKFSLDQYVTNFVTVFVKTVNSKQPLWIGHGAYSVGRNVRLDSGNVGAAKWAYLWRSARSVLNVKQVLDWNHTLKDDITANIFKICVKLTKACRQICNQVQKAIMLHCILRRYIFKFFQIRTEADRQNSGHLLLHRCTSIIEPLLSRHGEDPENWK